MAGIQSVLFDNNAAVAVSAGSALGMTEQGALLFLRLTPHTTPISRGQVQQRNVPAAGTHGLLWIHPKMGSTLESTRTGWQWVSPLMNPFARAKPKVLKFMY